MRTRSQRLCPRAPAPRPRPDCCFRPEQPLRLPDPGIYSQSQRFAAGAEITFANPDIHQTARIGTTGNPGDMELIGRRIRIVVTNFSDDAPAAGVQVHVQASRWGIGMPRVPIGAFAVDLGVASSAHARASHTIELGSEAPWRAFFVRVMHAKDRYTSNNEGVDAQQRLSIDNGAFALPFSVRNPLQRPATIELVVMTTQWSASVSPAALQLLHGQSAVATLSGHADLSGMAPSDRISFTIIATIEGQLFGGLTYRLGPSTGG